MVRYLVGVDDTDHGESIGTGALARELMLSLEREAGADGRGITRHQLLVHPDVPYTSHNSAACLELESAAGIDRIEELAAGFVGSLFHAGADPGVCVLAGSAADPGLIAFGRRAQTEVVRKEEALALGARAGARCRELGGAGIGVIGAVAACGLRMSRDDGRFISLPGARSLDGRLSAAEIRARVPIDRVLDEDGAPLADDALVDTRGWVRPDLSGGAVVLRVRRGPDGGWFVHRDRHLDQH